MSSKGVRIEVTDLDTGDKDSAVIQPGDYMVITVDPCHVAHTNKYGNGTHVVTIKDGPPPTV